MEFTDTLRTTKQKIETIARGYGLDFFTTIFELVSREELNEIASYGGFPVRYPYWRFGMEYEHLSKGSTYGLSKIYELVINNDPCYAYLLRTNSMMEHKLVMSHVYGHCDFFKNNYWFSKTYRKMMDEMANHGTRIRRYFDRYGVEKVEHFIDCCLSLDNLIDPFRPFMEKRTEPKAVEAVEEPQTPAVAKFKSKPHMESFINPPEILKKQREKLKEASEAKKIRFPERPEKDVLFFLSEHAPLEQWQRDIVNMVRDEAYYFVPQRQTKIMNEGWASYWHSKIMTRDLLEASEIIDFADVHSGTMGTQPGMINPYKIGIELFRDIEDRWNRGAHGKDYDECQDVFEKRRWNRRENKGNAKIFEVRRIYNDLTFIDEFLNGEFCEAQKLFTYAYDRRTNQYVIVDRDYRKVKEKLLFNLTNLGQPFIYVTDGNYQNRGELYLTHAHDGFDLDMNMAKDTLRSLCVIWNRPAHIETIIEGSRKRLSYNGHDYSEEFIRTED